MITQSQMARELHVSRSVINDNVRAGMPLTSIEAAKHWRRCHVREKWNQKAYDARRGDSAPSSDELDNLTRPVTHKEFAVLLESEFRRFEAESPKRSRSKTMPFSICPSLMLGVWAVKGLMAYAGTNDSKGATQMVNGLMEEVRDGNGDYLFKGVSEREDAKLSKGMAMLLEQSNAAEKKG
jgi:hypothetical protein